MITMKRICHRLLLLGLCLTVFSLQGCAYRYTYRTGIPPNGEPKVKVWQHILAWGWATPTSPVYLDDLSPSGVSAFGSYISFPNWLCTLVSVGFYSPQTIYVIPGDGFLGDEIEWEDGT